MEGLPDFTIPTVLSFLRTRAICRCACIAKEWTSCAQQRLTEMKQEAARARAQKTEDGKGEESWDLRRAIICKSLESVEKCIANGANLETLPRIDQTPLIYATIVSRLRIVQVLIIHGADVNAAPDNTTALMYAASLGRLAIVELLIKHGADIHTTTSEGDTALMRASEIGNIDVIRYLVARGANANVRNNYGKTALSLAQEENHGRVVEFLMAAGAPN